MATDASEVRKQHRFDEESLHAYLEKNITGFPRGSSKLQVLQYKSGQSNPTFYLKKEGRELVMRKKPPGQLLRGAHQVAREYRIQSALYQTGFPVPKPLAYCEDASVIGTEFYVMEHVRGRIFRDISLPELSPGERKDVYFAMINTLAHLHSLDFKKLGLQGYGKEGGFCKRQINTWTRQFQGAVKIASLPEVPSANKLMEWLPNNVPKTGEKTSIVHGDFRLENMIFHPSQPKVIAVLDWELSTLGDPLTDLAYNCAAYHWPDDIEAGFGNPMSSGGNINTCPGIPSREEYMKVYCAHTGVPYPIHDWEFYIALAYFRVASICEGVYARSKLGNASSETAGILGDVARLMCDVGLQVGKGLDSTKRRDIPRSSLSENITPFLAMEPLSERGRDLLQKVRDFVKNEVLPAERVFEEHLKNASDPWTIPPVMEQLKIKAKAAGLWNLFLPSESGLTQLEYAYMAEEMGRSPLGSEPFNCAAPDTGNMEVLHLFGTPDQKEKWLRPLLEGRIRSCYCMTEPDVASSDATNMQCTFTREGDEYVINGRKWWSSAAGDPRLKVAIVMGRTGNKDSTPMHKQHSMIIVPTDAPGFRKVRPLSVFGNIDAPYGHFEVEFNNVRVPASNIILGEGRGFEIAQGRLGPGRIHHCMRLLGMAERSLELMCQRAEKRVAFGRKLNRMQVIQHQVAESRMELDMARLLVLKAARMHDQYGSKKARKEIAMIKVVVPRMACAIIDRAIQVHGGGGVSDDFPLARFYAGARSLRLADGPDEVHLSSIARLELKEQFSKAML